jgi:signal transduction histidine kinase/CheY-like chemotaxis protein
MGESLPSTLSEPAGTRDVIQAAEKIAGSALRLVGGHRARVYRLDADAGTITCVASAGEGEAGARLSGSFDAEVMWSRRVFEGSSVLCTPDVLAEAHGSLEAPTRELIALEGLGALAAAAIRARGAVLGSIVLADRSGRCYTDRDRLGLSILADQMALVIEKLRVQAELVRERSEAAELAQVAGLIGENLDVRAVSQRIAESVLGLLKVHGSAIRLFRPDGALAPIALGGRAQEYAGAEGIVPASIGLIGRAAVEGRPMWTRDIRTDERFELSQELRDRNAAAGIVAGLAVPMRVAGAVIGVLSVGSPNPRTFAQGEIDLLQSFGDQAAIAISNAQTQETLAKQAERLRILHDIDLAIITETAPVAIAEAVLRRLRDLLGVPRAIVNLFDLAAGEVEWLAAVGRHRLHVGPGVRYPLTLAGDVDALRRGEPQMIDVRSLSPSLEAEALLASGVHAYMVVPMIAGGELIGSVSFGGDRADFPEEQVGIAQEVAAQLAIALRQARLVEELRTSYRDLQETQAHLAQAQKMEAIGQLAGGVAHDFNNLLTVISGRSHLALAQLPAEHALRRHIDLIRTTADRAAALTRQLLAFSRKQVLEPKVLDLNAVVAGLAPMLPRLVGENLEFTALAAPGLGRVKADPSQLEQVILNLAVNARDAMPQGGRLTIETGNVELDDAYARRHQGATPGRFVMLAVSDTGHGMDAATQARIFEPFFTTKEPGKGTGLGLATVFGIVKQSGGSIWVYSEPGHGTTFKVYLPRVDDATDHPAPAAEGSPLARASETILLVEDDDEVRALACETLEGNGYAVIPAASAAEALRVVGARQQPIHLLVTDVVLPQVSGRGLADLLAPDHRDLRVLYISGYTDDAIVRHGVLEAGTAFLQKPFTPHTLLSKVRKVLDRKS